MRDFCSNRHPSNGLRQHITALKNKMKLDLSLAIMYLF
jgi:hypothetical protein